jgi:putative PIN family toxin of toxin-antitoxin system
VLRVVVDPNVFVSAVIKPAGVSAEVVRAGLAGRFRVVVSPTLIGELVDVLARPKLQPYASPDEVATLVDAIVGTAEEHADPAIRTRRLRDPDDEYLVALAMATGADLVVSGDRDLLDGAVAVDVVSPRELFDRLHSFDDR